MQLKSSQAIKAHLVRTMPIVLTLDFVSSFCSGGVNKFARCKVWERSR